jgi:hypothetical protein
MCLSVFLSIVIGMYLFLISLSVLLQEQRYKKLLVEFYNNHPLLNFTGVIGILLGLLVIVGHNMWVADWPVLITIIGWIVLLQGICRVFAPVQYVKKMKELQTKKAYDLMVWVWLVVGIYMVWAGIANS